MNSSIINTKENQPKYSKLLSSFFCSVAITALTILCLLNNLTFDIYTMFILLKVVVPGAFSFLVIGYIIGSIFDSLNKEIKHKKIVEEKQAYEIPSMFGPDVSELEENADNLEVL